MTPNKPKPAIPRIILIIGALSTLSAALAGAARYVGNVETRTHAESVYVRIDSFAIHRKDEAARHQRDSLITDAKMARIDTSLNALVRACRKRGECP